MNPTHTPTEPGKYYWRKPGYDWKCLLIEEGFDGELIDEQSGTPINELGGEWLGKVPEPGTTFTIEEIWAWLVYLNNVVWKVAHRLSRDDLVNPQHGIAATTQRNKEPK